MKNDTYTYAPFIHAGQALPPIANMIELHDKNGTLNEIEWFTDRDTLLEYIRNSNEIDIADIVARPPENVSKSAFVFGAMLVEIICNERKIPLPAWAETARFDLRAPYFSKITRQKGVRKYLAHNSQGIFVNRGLFQENKDYRTI